MTRKKTKVLQNIPVELKSIIKTPISIPPNTSILDARDILLRHKIGRLVIEFGKKPVGIITEKDIARSVSLFSKKPLGKIIVRDIMTKDLVTVNTDSTIKECAKLMKKHGISSIVVVNSRGGLVGVVTKTDLVGTFLVQSTASLEISKVMTKKVITASPEESIFEIESLLFNNNIRRIVIIKNKVPVGIITYRDFIPTKPFDMQKGLSDPGEIIEMSQIPQINELNVNRLSYLITFTASDIMTKNPFVVYPDDVLYTAAILMIRHDISGIPVVKSQKLVGIITKSDIVNVLAQE